MSKIIGVYKIDYFNGVIQEKNLVLQEDYDNLNRILIEAEINFNKSGNKEDEDKIKAAKKNIKVNFGENYFTTNSPLFRSVSNNGIMELPLTMGGSHKVQIIKL